MFEEKYNFYSPTNIKIHDLDRNIKDHLAVMEQLDIFTKRHSENVANLVSRICEYMRCKPVFSAHTIIAGYIHDIGKLLVPPTILNKPDKLTDEEYSIMKNHTTLGYELCMKDMSLRPYSDGPLYHHEALDGSGYPNGLTKKDIPYSAQIIRVADEYDALVTKRQYKTHVNISETLKDLIKDAQPSRNEIALDHLKENEKLGKINSKPLRALFKVVIDDILYEISCVMDYTSYLKEQIKRLELIENYENKKNKSNRQKTKDYYQEGMNILLTNGETADNYKQLLSEYKKALEIRQDRIDKLYDEIKIIKKLKI